MQRIRRAVEPDIGDAGRAFGQGGVERVGIRVLMDEAALGDGFQKGRFRLGHGLGSGSGWR